jgi:glutamate/tyrosine decarboxylase-like PLP-dependent enzyme
MNTHLANDFATLSSLLDEAKENSISFLNTIHDHPTSTPYRNAVHDDTVHDDTVHDNATNNAVYRLDDDGMGAAQTLHEFQKRFAPMLVATGGPRYWGFVTGGATPAALIGDWLTAVYDANPQSPQGQGDISAVIELETIHLLRQLFNLPNEFVGGFVSGAMMSNFTCLAVARQWIGQESGGRNIAQSGVREPMHVLTSTPHSSVVKALSLLGLGSQNVTQVKTLDGNREAMDMADLEKKLQALNGQPCIVIASGGTVNTVDFDDFRALATLKERYGFWWHIDAAFGGFVACSPAHKHLVDGWEHADSITIDCHKWLNVPYDSAVFFVKEQYSTLQVETFQNSNAPYLGNPLENFSYLNFLPENSRRLRALPAWFTLRAYGKEGYREIVEECVARAQQLGAYIEHHERFELLAPVRLNTVCFTLSGAENEQHVTAFLTTLNASGRVFMTPTVYGGRKGIRAAFVNWRTTEDDVRIAIEAMEEALRHGLNG